MKYIAAIGNIEVHSGVEYIIESELQIGDYVDMYDGEEELVVVVRQRIYCISDHSFIFFCEKIDHEVSTGRLINKDIKIPDVAIEELSLSTRAYNCIRNVRPMILRFGDLVKYSRKDFSMGRNVGKKSIAEIDNLIKSFGYEWEP